jgi:hypothetical protein
MMDEMQAYMRATRELLEEVVRAWEANMRCGCGICRIRMIELKRQFDLLRTDHHDWMLRLDIAAVERGERLG